MQPEPQVRDTLGTVRHARVLFELLSEGPAHHKLTELANRSGLSIPTVHRLLRSLVAAGLVEQDPCSQRYGLGSELVLLAERYLDRLPVLNALSPYLVELRNVTKATVLVGLLIGNSVVYADRVEGDTGNERFRESHRAHDAFATAAGRILLAHAPYATWAGALSCVPSGIRSTDDDRAVWAASRFVTTGGDLLDPVEIAVPVQGAGGSVLAALSATAHPHLFPEEFAEGVAGELLRVARLAGRALVSA